MYEQVPLIFLSIIISKVCDTIVAFSSLHQLNIFQKFVLYNCIVYTICIGPLFNIDRLDNIKMDALKYKSRLQHINFLKLMLIFVQGLFYKEQKMLVLFHIFCHHPGLAVRADSLHSSTTEEPDAGS